MGLGCGPEGLLRAAADPAGQPWGRASFQPRAGPAHLGRFLRQQELAQEICLENQVCTGQGRLRAGRLVHGWMEAVSRGQMSTRGWVETVGIDVCRDGSDDSYIRVRRLLVSHLQFDL